MFGNGFYNPYMYQPYYQTTNMARNFGGLTSASANRIGKSGLAELLSKFSFSEFLNGASKTLNVVNQAIPIFYQVRPIINNAKTMFRIMGAVKDDGNSKKSVSKEIRNNSISTSTSASNTLTQTSTQNARTSENESSTENPIFFI